MLCPSMLQCLVTMIYTRREVLKMTCPLRIRRQPSITLHLAMFTARFFINFEYNLILINSIKPVPLNLPNLIQVMPIVKPPKTTEVKGTETLPQVLSGQSIPCLPLKEIGNHERVHETLFIADIMVTRIHFSGKWSEQGSGG